MNTVYNYILTSLTCVLTVCGIVLFTGCTPISEPEDGDILRFEEDYYYIYDEKRPVYRSLDFVAVRPADGVTLDEFNELTGLYGLSPVMMFSHYPLDRVTERAIRYNRPAILQVPSGDTADNYYKTYPFENSDGIGDHPMIKYSIPVYNLARDGAPENWVYINNKIVIHPFNDDPVPEEIIEQFQLEFLSKDQFANMYDFQVTDNSPGSSLEISRAIFEIGDFYFVVPDMYSYITTH